MYLLKSALCFFSLEKLLENVIYFLNDVDVDVVATPLLYHGSELKRV